MPFTDSKPISNTDLARNKPEALVNILIVYSNKIHSCQTATAPKTAEKAIGLISKKKKKKEIPLPEQHTFLYTSFLCRCFCTTMFLLARFIRFMEEIQYVLTCSWLVRGCFCRCCCFLFFFFFTTAHYNLGRCLFSHRAARKLSCSILLPTKYIIPLRFLSLALALSSVINVNVDIKTYI